MAIAAINWNPTEKVLRQFGWISLVGFPLIAWTFSGRPMSFDDRGPWIPTMVGLALGITLAVAGLVYPKAVKPAFVTLSLITFPIGLVVGELFLTTVFFLLFGFVSVIFRIVGYDPMTRAFDSTAASYWTPKAQAASPKQYFQQY
jgi:hypothetical protein